MAVTARAYVSAGSKLANKEIDWDSDTIKVAAVVAAYTPNVDTHDYWNDVVANEASGTGYTAGGWTLAGKTNTTDAATDQTRLDAADLTASGLTLTFRYLVVYDATPGTDATRPLIGYVDAGADVVVSGDLTVTWHATGVVTITSS